MSRTRAAAFIAALSVGLALTAGTASAAVAPVNSSEVESTFTNPYLNGGTDGNLQTDTSIIDHVVKLIDNTPNGGTIVAGIYRIGGAAGGRIRTALSNAANQKNITVRVVDDGADGTPEGNDSPESGWLESDIGPENYRHCHQGSNNACISTNTGGIMHSKYMLFSATKDPSGVLKPYVSWFGSANDNAKGQQRLNNTITVYNDQHLYQQFYDKIWSLMWNAKGYSDFFDSSSGRGYFYSTNSQTTVYASPEKQTDFVANQLGRINRGSDCGVRAIQTEFHRSAVVDQLVHLKNYNHKFSSVDGCNVYVVVGENKKENGTAHIYCSLRQELYDNHIPVHKAFTHDKAFIVKSRFNGSSDVGYRVFTGSHNMSKGALRDYDELFVKLHVPSAIYGSYYDHFGVGYRNSGGIDKTDCIAGH